MAAIIIGQVAIKVRPDTKGFHREAKRELERRNMPEVDIDLKVGNVNDLQARQALDRLEAAAKGLGREMDETFRDRVLNAWLNVTGEDDVKALRDTLDDFKETVRVNVDLDAEGAMARWKDFEDAINAAKNSVKDLTVKWDIDDSSFDELAEAYKRLETMHDTLDRDVNFRVNVDPDNLESVESAMAEVMGRLEDTAHIDLKIRSDKDAIEQALKGIDEGLAEWARIHAVPVSFKADEASLHEMHDILTAVRDASKIDVETKVNIDNLEYLEATLTQALEKILHGTLEIPAELKVSIVDALDSITRARDNMQQALETDHGLALTMNVIFDADEAAYSDELARMLDSLETRLTVDMGDAERAYHDWKLREWGASIQLELKNEAAVLARIKEFETRLSNTADIDIDVNADALRRIELLMDLLTNSVDLRITADGVDTIERELKRLIDDYDGEKITLNADADTLAARAKLLIASHDRVVTFYAHVSERSLAQATAALEALSGFRMLSSTLQNIKELFENLDKNIPLIGTIAEAVMGLSAWLITAASNCFALAQDLARISGAGLALPGLLGGIATGAGIAFAALKDFNGVVPEFATALGEMQDAISNNFWAVFEQPLRDLTNSLLPAFGKEAAGTAAYLGGSFAALAKELDKALGPEILRTLFENLNQSILIGAQSADEFANIISILGQTGSEYLPRMAQWFKEILDRFNDWLIRSRDTGKLTEWVEVALERLYDLGQVIKNTFRIFDALADAAAAGGGSKLSMVAATLDKVATAMERVSWQTKAIDVIKASHDAMHQIATISGPAVKKVFSTLAEDFVGIMGSVAPAVGSMLSGVATAVHAAMESGGVQSMFDGIRAGIDALEPMWQPLGKAIGEVGKIVGAMAEHFGPLLAELLELLSDFAVNVGDDLVALVKGGGALLLDLLKVIAVPLKTFLEGLIGILGVVGNNEFGFALIVGGLGALWAALKVGALAKGVVDVATAIGKFNTLGGVGGVVNTIHTGLTNLGGSVGPALAGKFATVTSKLSGFAGALATAAPFLGVAGLAVGAVALAIGVEKAGQNAALAIRPTSDYADALQDVANGVKDIGDIQSMFKGDGRGFWTFLTANDNGEGKAADDINSLSDALKTLDNHASSGFWERLTGIGEANGRFWQHSDSMEQSKRSLENFDKALANMVQSGNLDAVAIGEDMIRDAVDKTGKSRKWVIDQMPEYKSALENQQRVAETTARVEQQARKDAADAWTGWGHVFSGEARAHGDVIAAIRDNYDGFNADANKALTAVNEATKENLREATTEWLETIAKQAEAQDQWADNIAELTQRMGADMGAYFASLGPDAAVAVADMVNMSDAELQKWAGRIRPALDDVVGTVGGAYQQMVDTSASVWSSLTEAQRAAFEKLGIDASTDAVTWTDAVSQGLRSGDPVIREAAQTILDGARETLIGTPGPNTAIGSGYVNSVASGMSSSVDVATTAAGGVANAVTGSFDARSVTTAATKGGAALVDSLAGGITARAIEAYNAGDLTAGQTLEGIASHVGGISLKGEESVKGYITEFQRLADQAHRAGDTVAGQVYQGLAEALGKHGQAAVDSGQRYAADLAKQGDLAKTNATTLARNAAAAAEFQKGYHAQAGAAGGREYVDGLRGKAEAARIAGNTVAAASYNQLHSYASQYVHAGDKASRTYAEGMQIKSALNALRAAGYTAAEASRDAAGNIVFTGVGQNAAVGFASGISQYEWMVRDAAKNMAANAKRAAENAMLIRSPSRVMAEVGGYVTKGFAVGILGDVPEVVSAAVAMAEAFNEAITDTLEPVFDAEVVGSLSSKSAAAMAAARGEGSVSNRTLNYYAAEGSSLNSEEDLFAAAERGRLVWGY